MALNPDAKTGAIRDLPLGLIYGAGLVLLFVGERLLVGQDLPRYVLSGLGVAAMVGSTALRFLSKPDRPGDVDRAPAERRLAYLSIGGLIAIAMYFATTDPARAALGIAAMSPDKRGRVDAVMTVAWIAALLLSALPLLFGELALAPMRRAERIEARRVQAAVRSGVTIALALVYSSLFVFAAGQLDWKLDYSYFRTSKPSESTTNVAASATEPIEVTAFFPALNDVGAEVETYLRDLAHAAPNLKVKFEDRLLVPQIAKDKKVTNDGVIVLTRGPSREVVSIGAEMKTAGSKLKNLDQDFQKALLKVLREARTAYLTIGHGELNDAGEGKVDGRSSKLIKSLLEQQNYVVKDLGLTQGLANEVPNDASLVIVLGPTRALSPEEVAALGRYADKGGHLLLALDPDGGADDAPLAATVGLTWSPVVLANDRVYVPRRKNASDKAFIGTNRYSSHASVSTLSRYGSSLHIVFDKASSLDKHEGSSEKIDFTVKSMPETFGDANQNYTFDPDEKRSTYNVAAAVSKPGTGEAPKGKDASEMRAIVVADADCFSDAILAGSEPNRVFTYDAVRWLGGEESFAGAIVNNDDVHIEHTKQKDVLWFYGTIFGLPGLVLGLGLWRTRRARGAGKRPRGGGRDGGKPSRKKPAKATPPPVEEEEAS